MIGPPLAKPTDNGEVLGEGPRRPGVRSEEVVGAEGWIRKNRVKEKKNVKV